MGEVQIVITMTSDGKINVQGPLENKVIMFGLLEVARETVTKFNDAAAAGNRIVVPPLSFPKLGS